MEKELDKYINENDIINIMFTRTEDTRICDDTIYLQCRFSENNKILRKIINSNKFISVKFDCVFTSYRNINVLLYSKEIEIPRLFNKNKTLNIIDKCINLQNLTIDSPYGFDPIVIDKLCEKEFLKYVKIANIHKFIRFDKVYRIIEIKSLDTLFLDHAFCSRYDLQIKQISTILHYIVNNLHKSMKIIIGSHYIKGYEMIKFFNLIKYHFKINTDDGKHSFYFNYIAATFSKFDNLYDFKLYHQ